MKRIKINPDQLGLFDAPRKSVPELFSKNQNCGENDKKDAFRKMAETVGPLPTSFLAGNPYGERFLKRVESAGPLDVTVLALPVGADRSIQVWMRQSNGWFHLVDKPENPISRFSGSFFCAIESHRAMMGRSIELAGIMINNEHWCSNCLKYQCVSLRVKPIYEGITNKFTCYRCSNSFSGDFYE